MSGKQWMPLYIADYLADTAHLGATESGAYLHLIMHYWMHGGLPTDERALARIAKVHPPHWSRIREAVAPFFGHPKTGGLWVQKRIDLELAKNAEISNKRKAAAEQMLSKRSASAEQMLTQSQSQSQKKKDSEPNGSDAVPASPPSGPVSADAENQSEPGDVRTELFKRGAELLSRITGKPNSGCRALIGRWLKAVDDEAIHVLSAIDDAARDRIADPVPWIGSRLGAFKRGPPGGVRVVAMTERERRNAEAGQIMRELREYAGTKAGIGRSDGSLGCGAVASLPRPSGHAGTASDAGGYDEAVVILPSAFAGKGA